MVQPKLINKKSQSFYLRIAFFVMCIVLFLLLIYFTFIRNTFIQMFEYDYNKRVVEINEFLVQQVDGDKVEAYAKDFKKDEYYFNMLSTLYEMKEIFRVDSLYIMVEEGENYRYIFNSDIDENKVYNDSWFGIADTKENFPEGDDVLHAGKPFEKAKYRKDKNGGIYYAYTPIINSRGNVVAFLGTNVDAGYMRQSITSFEIKLILYSAITLLVFFVIIMLYGKYSLSTPIIHMSKDIQNLSKGEMEIEFSSKLLKRRDEFGLIYRSFKDVEGIINRLFRSMNYVTKEVLRGNLNARIFEQDIYQGSYYDFMSSANQMLDNNQRLLDMMPSAVIFYDKDLNLIYHNNPAQAKYTINTGTSDTIIGVLERNNNLVKEIYQKLCDCDDNNYSGTFAFQDVDGVSHHYNAFLIKMDENAKDGSFCAVFTDVTEYVEMSERAEASNKAKSEFLSRMSHEIRTPMNAIIGMTQVAKRQTDNCELLNHLSTIESSSTYLLTIINDVLDISKIEYGNFELFPGPFDLKELLKDVLHILEYQAGQKDLRLCLIMDDFDEKELYLIGDNVRFRQVVINLISNAIKFSHKENRILVTLNELPAKDPEYTRFRLSIRDFGIGIPIQSQQRIFEAFEQADGGIIRQYGGTGLGLPISNRIVNLMGGKGIDVISEEGKGSEFFFELEFENVERPPTVVSTEAEVNFDLSKRCILIVDDIDINREIVSSLLEETGVTMEHADDGSTAVTMFENSELNHYDLILMDVQMRIMDGHTAAKTIRSLERCDSNSVKIVAMSANAYQSDIEKALESGMNDYITKPVDYMKMMSTITKVLGGST